MSDAGLAPGFSAGGGFDLSMPEPLMDYGAGLDFNMPALDFSGMEFGDLMEGGDMFFGELTFADGGVVTKNNKGATDRRMAQVDAAEGAAVRGEDASKAQQDTREEQKKATGNLGAQLLNYLKRQRGYADGGQVKKSLTAKAPGYANGGRATMDSTASIVDEPVTMAITGAADIAGGVADAESGAIPVGANGRADFSADQLAEEVIAYFGEYANKPPSNSGWDAPVQPYTDKSGNTYEGMYYDDIGNRASPGEGATLQGVRSGPKAGQSYDDYQSQNPYAKTYNMDGSFRDIELNLEEEGWGPLLAQLAMTAGSIALSGNPAFAFARSMGTKALGDGIRTGMSGTMPKNYFGGTDKRKPLAQRDSSANGFAGGGEIDGPGTGISDSIPIRVSDGEYIIPKDVVDTLGVEFFDELRDMFHTPVSQQKQQGAA
jgi:hypothetical protein